ncbi:glycosyltransferase family 2 protein [Flavisolibacter nicotianae]|uniref:glycosyltransferase family 2 protein n=1 Tax=Flavisolibacter nicotianae TaxID=2364882 RepID=UPI000EAB7BC7|nr:glycosyltransferase [Flavisolibacter nicotianae]
MTPPLVSIVTVTYNHENYIRQCLEGIVMQKTTFPIEVIVGEDCSTDNTRAVVREFEERYPEIVKPIYHQTNVGAGRNFFEFCYPKLQGKYIAICEGDDYWTDPYKLQKQVDFLEQNQNYVLCFHPRSIVDQDNRMIYEQLPKNSITLYRPKDIFHVHIPTLTVVFRYCHQIDIKAILEQKLFGEYYFFWLFSRYGAAADLGFVGANYRQHTGGLYSGLTKAGQSFMVISGFKQVRNSNLYDSDQKKEIKKEMRIRKKRFLKTMLKKKDFVNAIKMAFT